MYGTAVCNGGLFYFMVLQGRIFVFYYTVLQFLMVGYFMYGTALCIAGVFYCTVLECVMTVCFIVRYCSV